MDIDDYINSLIKENEHLKNLVKSLKDEIRIQRKEIAVLKDERRAIFDAEKGPNLQAFIEP
jgi:hypothetical protein